MGIIAQSSTLGIIQEVTPGVIPASPTFQLLPVNSIDFARPIMARKKRFLGQRTHTLQIVTGSHVTGVSGFDLTFNNWKNFLIEVLRCGGSLYHNISIASSVLIAVDASGGTDKINASGALDFATQGLEPGMYIKTSGFSNSANNGVFRINSMPTTTQLVVRSITGNDMTTEAAGSSVTITVANYADSTSAGKTYTLRHYYEEEDGTPVYQYYRGCLISRITLSIRTGEVIQGLIEFKGIDRVSTVQSGESMVDYTPETLISHISVQHLYLQGLSPERIFTEFDLSLDNVVHWRRTPQSTAPSSIIDTDFLVSLRAVAYHENLEVDEIWEANGDISCGLMVNDGSNTIAININKLQVREDAMPVKGRNSFVFEPIVLDSFKDDNGKLIYFNFIS